MSFIWPTMLLWLLLIPLGMALYILQQRRRQQLAARYGSLGFVQESAGQRLGWRRHVVPVFFLTGLILLLLAVARPQTVVSLPRIEGTVILAFDVSGSMAADDLQPTRLEAAKAAATEFVQHQPSTVLIGVVAFSDGGFTVLPPTNEQDTILSTINRLTPQRGTSLGEGILTSLDTIVSKTQQEPELDLDPATTITPPTPVPSDTSTPAVIVLLTDGENTSMPDPRTAAQLAADLGVRIHTVGIGSPAGTVLHINDFTVHTRLDEPTLQQISQLTGGTYYNATTEQDLYIIYENLDAQWVVKPEKMEVTSIFAGISMLVLLLGGAISLLWFSRLP